MSSVNIAHAASTAFSIGDKFEAYFPDPPVYEGVMGKGSIKYKSFSFTDEQNIIIYGATYSVEPENSFARDIWGSLKNFVKGNASSVKGKLVYYDQVKVDSTPSAISQIDYRMDGVSVVKYSVVSYKDGRFFQWSVQYLPKYSKLDGEDVFIKYFRFFKVY